MPGEGPPSPNLVPVFGWCPATPQSAMPTKGHATRGEFEDGCILQFPRIRGTVRRTLLKRVFVTGERRTQRRQAEIEVAFISLSAGSQRDASPLRALSCRVPRGLCARVDLLQGRSLLRLPWLLERRMPGGTRSGRPVGGDAKDEPA